MRVICENLIPLLLKFFRSIQKKNQSFVTHKTDPCQTVQNSKVRKITFTEFPEHEKKIEKHP